MAFAQDNLPLSTVEKIYPNFINSGEFLRRSKFFKAGADYRALIIADQKRQKFQEVIAHLQKSIDVTTESDDMKKYDADMEKLNAEETEVIRNLCSTTWVQFRQDLGEISMSPEKFGELVEDKSIAKIMAANPY